MNILGEVESRTSIKYGSYKKRKRIPTGLLIPAWLTRTGLMPINIYYSSRKYAQSSSCSFCSYRVQFKIWYELKGSRLEFSLLSHLTQDNKSITFTNVPFYLQGRLGTGEARPVQSNNEYALHSTANSMLVNVYAKMNIEQAVIYKTCEIMNHNIHLIPQGREYWYD